MAVNGVGTTDAARVEQMRTDQRTEERKTQDTDRSREAQENPRAVEAGRGENMDVTA